MAAEIQEKQAAREIDAPYCPFTATVTSAALIVVDSGTAGLAVSPRLERDSSGVGVLYTQSQDDPVGTVAYKLLTRLKAELGYGDSDIATGDQQLYNSVRNCSIIGLKIKDRLQLAAADAMQYCVNNNRRGEIPPELWSHLNFKPAIWCDPYDVIVPSDQRQWVKYDQLAAYLKIDVDLAAVETDAVKQAQFAMALACAANL